MGLGGVGRRLAKVLGVFRTRVVATDLFPLDKPEGVAELWPIERLPDLLESSDFVILSAPLNASTRGMIDAAALARMKPHALLVNVARGPLVVTADLVRVLQSRALAGAVMDVTDPEPLPTDSPLWEMPNVIITPHVGGQCATRADDVTRIFCENLRRYQADQPLWNFLSDKQLGFPIRGNGGLLWADRPDA